MDRKYRRVVWVLWMLLFPAAAAVLVPVYAGWQVSDWLSFLPFVLLIALAAMFPIHIRETSIVPLQGVALAVFLLQGFSGELLITQIGIVIGIARMKLDPEDWYRLPLNSLIFLATSSGAAAVYYAAGGQTGSALLGELSLGLIVLYVVTYFFINNGLIYAVQRLTVKHDGVRFFDEALKWEVLSLLFVLPVGLTLALLYELAGPVVLILAALPVTSIAIILSFYGASRETANQLKKVSQFGANINERLETAEVLELFMDTCWDLFDPRDVCLYEEDGDGGLQPVFRHTKAPGAQLTPESGDGVSRLVYKSGRSRVYMHDSDIPRLARAGLPAHTKSVMSAPAVRAQKIVGVVTLLSQEKRAFGKDELMLLEIMAGYLTVAMQNARHLSRAKKLGERCALTGLYNFRFFEEKLVECREPFAVVLLDLDHFKQVNDTFGHDGGNDVLREAAEMIETCAPDDALAARYGGEEFVLLLPSYTAEEAAATAEHLREQLAEREFTLPDLRGEKRKAEVTASIGVAGSVPGEDPLDVLRNADRAMYTGAKQKGRNRVALHGFPGVAG